MKRKNSHINKFLMTCFIAASLICYPAFSEENIQQATDLPTIASLETFPSPSEYKAIYLDSSKVEHPVLKGVFPSPSEYSAKNNIPADAFTPPKENPEVMERTYKVESSGDSEEPAFSEVKNHEINFDNMEFFAPPSEYKKPEDDVKTVDYRQEQTEDNEHSESYYASAEENDTTPSLEGYVITNITFKGLRLINENSVLNVMTTRNGATFNAYKLQQDLQNIYNTGYFTDSMYIEPSVNDDGTASVEIVLQENPEVKQVEIKGSSVFKNNELSLFTKNLIGMPQNINCINESIEKINQYYEKNGYILAKVTNVDDTDDGTLILTVSEGIINSITFEGAKKTKDYVIQRNIMTQPGTVYNEELLKKDLSKIYATQIFEEVNRKIEPCPDNEGEYIVTIVVKEASSNSVSIGGGIDNALGVFGSVSVTERNFLGRGQELGLTGMLGSGLLLSDASIKNRMNYQIELNFKEPHFINADNSLISKLYLRELGSYKVPLAVERRFGINGIIKHKIKGNDYLTANLGLGYENIRLKEGDFDRIAQQYAARNMNIALREKQLTGGNFINIAPAIQYSNLDNEFMPRNGLIASAGFIESFAVDNVKNTNGKLIGNITKYIPVFKKSTLLVGTKGGIKVHGDNMPDVMAFTLGGPYNIRGFRMSGVGSGESFLMGSAELQTPIPFMDRFKYDVLKNLRFAFFVDAGKIWNPTITSTLYDRPNSAITAGVGIRVNIPGMGPITVDYGLPLTNVGKYNRRGGYFTFGTGGLYDSYY